MRATGIVRRIDELGRVVIPRKFAARCASGRATPWKSTPTGMARLSSKSTPPSAKSPRLPKTTRNRCSAPWAISHASATGTWVVAASGVPRKELWDKPISRELEAAIQNRQSVTINKALGGKVFSVTNEEEPAYTAQVFFAHHCRRRSHCGVLLLSREQGVKMGDTELKVAETTAGIVGRQMEQ